MRLDMYLTQHMGVETRSKAANLIKMGRVKINGVLASKCGIDITTQIVELSSDMEYVSMGGYKLAKALDEFGIDVSDKKCVDIGASNGGFTQCLLDRGASVVYAVDVGECALPKPLRDDSRVKVRERLNAREISLSDTEGRVDLAVIDVSFISLKLILPAVYGILDSGAQIIALVKPQFEVGKAHLSKKGIVISSKVREDALESVIETAKSINLTCLGRTTAPEREGKNIEYLIRLVKS